MIDPAEMVEQSSNIRAMVQSPGWQFYTRVVMDKIAMTHEIALADDPSQLLYHRGSVDGLKAAILTATDVLNVAREASGERRDAHRAMADAGLTTV